jgi:cytochrome P450
MIRKAEEQIAVIAERLVSALAERGCGDFVTDVATPMPLQIICSMAGVPQSEYPAVIEATSAILALGDPGFRSPDGRDRGTILLDKLGYLHALMDELARKRRAEPADDLVSALVHANVDGEMLSDRDLGLFFTLLVVAGNETTRNAISHALALFTEHPGQRALLLDDLGGRLPGAVEEIIRYASPVTWMRRNVTRDVELSGHAFHAGDRVVLYYVSANRDESVFAEPSRFDIARSPNPHLGFGGPGPHFCLGAHLARREITVLLTELFSRLPGIHATAEPHRQRASFVNGIASLPCSTS